MNDIDHIPVKEPPASATAGEPEEQPTPADGQQTLTVKVSGAISDRPEYELVRLPVDDIDDTGANVRGDAVFNPADEEDKALMKSSTNGNLQPGIASRPPNGGKVKLIFGFRRLAALKALQAEEEKAAAKKKQPPPAKRTMLLLLTDKQFSEEEALEMQLIENCQRKNMNAVDRAEAYARLHATHDSIEAVADKVKFSKSVVSQYLTVHKHLPPAKKEKLRSGEITFQEAYKEALIKKGPKGKHGKTNVRPEPENLTVKLEGDGDDAQTKTASKNGKHEADRDKLIFPAVWERPGAVAGDSEFCTDSGKGLKQVSLTALKMSTEKFLTILTKRQEQEKKQ